MIVAYVRDDADREVLAELAQRRLVTLARSARDAIALTRTVDFAGGGGKPLCVLGMESLPGAAPGEFARWLSAEAPECPLIIRYDVTSVSARDIWAMASLLELDVRDSLRAHEDLRTMLIEWPVSWFGTATPAIVRRLAPAAPGDWRDFLVKVATACSRETSEEEVSAATGLAARTFRSRLCRLRALLPNVPPFPRLNALFVTANVLWWRTCRLQSRGEAAHRAGFSNPDALDRYVRRNWHTSPAALLAAGGFDAQLEALLKVFGSA